MTSILPNKECGLVVLWRGRSVMSSDVVWTLMHFKVLVIVLFSVSIFKYDMWTLMHFREL